MSFSVGVTGASGFIGTALCTAAEARGWSVARLGRQPDPAALGGCDAVVHLAGESVQGRWTGAKKREIERSRIEGTAALVAALERASRRPQVLVSASAVGYYGDRGDEVLDESSAPGDDFLARVCAGWERAAARAESFGIRTAMVRTGIVLGLGGGALPEIMRPFEFGAGGPLGNGRQYVPWIHIEDVVRLYLFIIENATLRGPVNGVAPGEATNAQFAKALGAAMHRPALLPTPAFALRLALGEFAESVLGSQRVVPRVARDARFGWSYPDLEAALQALLAHG